MDYRFKLNYSRCSSHSIGGYWSIRPAARTPRRAHNVSLKSLPPFLPCLSRRPLLLSPVARSYTPNQCLMLTSRITLPTPSAPSQEDIFSSALSALFTDDIQNSHGSPGGSLIYTSPSFGDITLHIPAHPDVEEERKLFAHYLWNASLVAAEGIEMASVAVAAGLSKDGNGTSGEGEQWNPRWWNVRGKRVLELGAGMLLARGLAHLFLTGRISS